MTRLLFVTTVGCAAPLAVWGQTVVPRERTMHMTTQAGRELRVFGYSNWHRDCSPDAPPQIAIRTQPAHGTISVRSGQSSVSVIREGAPDCSGHTYPNATVWYIPTPGFHGTDQFDYSVVSPNTSSHDTVVVDVR